MNFLIELIVDCFTLVNKSLLNFTSFFRETTSGIGIVVANYSHWSIQSNYP